MILLTVDGDVLSCFLTWTRTCFKRLRRALWPSQASKQTFTDEAWQIAAQILPFPSMCSMFLEVRWVLTWLWRSRAQSRTFMSKSKMKMILSSSAWWGEKRRRRHSDVSCWHVGTANKGRVRGLFSEPPVCLWLHKFLCVCIYGCAWVWITLR